MPVLKEHDEHDKVRLLANDIVDAGTGAQAQRRFHRAVKDSRNRRDLEAVVRRAILETNAADPAQQPAADSGLVGTTSLNGKVVIAPSGTKVISDYCPVRVSPSSSSVDDCWSIPGQIHQARY